MADALDCSRRSRQAAQTRAPFVFLTAAQLVGRATGQQEPTPAAEVLGFGLVHGVKPHICIEQLRRDSIRRLGLLHIEPGHSVDVYLRIPLAPQSVFRGSVLRGGIPVSDML